MTRTVIMKKYPAASLREQVEAALERVSRILVQHAGHDIVADEHDHDPVLDQAEVARAMDAAHFLGRIAAGWAALPEEAPFDGAGFGSTVVVTDMDDGRTETCTLMTGALLDIDAGDVSLASPMGQALLGAKEADIVIVQTPQRTRTLRVRRLTTLYDRLREEVSDMPAA